MGEGSSADAGASSGWRVCISSFVRSPPRILLRSSSESEANTAEGSEPSGK